jgi:hypothetical protein
MTQAIEKITVPDIFPSMAARDLAYITGEDPGFRAQSFYYRSTASGAEYQEIVGGLVPPAKLPGFAVVVALGRHDDPRINPGWKVGTKRISVLAEYKAEDLPGLVGGALVLRSLFAPALDKGFYCDPNESLSFRIAQLMESLKNEPPMVLVPGLYFQQATAFRDYVSTLNLYRKILVRGDCAKLRKAMSVFPREAMGARGERAWEDYPEVMALAYAVHGLMVNPLLDMDEGAIEKEEDAA